MSASPFIFTNGTGYLRNMKVQGADIVNLSVDYADISNVNIEAGVIAAGAVTDHDNGSGNIPAQIGNGITDNNWHTVPGTQISLSSDSGNPVLFYYDIYCSGAHAGPTNASVSVRAIRATGNKVIGTVTATGMGSISNSGNRLLLDAVPSAGTYNYAIQIRNVSADTYVGGGGSLIAQCNRK